MAHVGSAKKVKAPDPPLRDPEVAPGEAADSASLPPEVRTIVKNKCLGVPSQGHLLPKTRLQTLAKVFLVNLPGRAENGPFLVTDGILSPDPDFSSEANQHPLIERSSADNVFPIWLVFATSAHWVIDIET